MFITLLNPAHSALNSATTCQNNCVRSNKTDLIDLVSWHTCIMPSSVARWQYHWGNFGKILKTKNCMYACRTTPVFRSSFHSASDVMFLTTMVWIWLKLVLYVVVARGALVSAEIRLCSTLIPLGDPLAKYCFNVVLGHSVIQSLSTTIAVNSSYHALAK